MDPSTLAIHDAAVVVVAAKALGIAIQLCLSCRGYDTESICVTVRRWTQTSCAHLDVAVCDAQAVAVFQRHHELPEQPPDEALTEGAALYTIPVPSIGHRCRQPD